MSQTFKVQTEEEWKAAHKEMQAQKETAAARQRRNRIAEGFAFQMLGFCNRFTDEEAKETAEFAVRFADALIQELDR